MNSTPAARRSTASTALDAATPGRRGTTRAGFHLIYRVERFVSASGLPGARNTADRCTCARKGNHAEIAR